MSERSSHVIESHLWCCSRPVMNRIHESRIESSSWPNHVFNYDYERGWSGYTLVVECKDCDKIRPKMMCEIEGVLSRYGKFETIGILVSPLKENFTKNSKDRVNSSGYNLILTD
ncbi:18209_t:CDS:2, partial [Gigaspora margarita]